MGNRGLTVLAAGIIGVGLIGGITGMVFAVNGFDGPKIETKISDLKDELPRESSLSLYVD